MYCVIQEIEKKKVDEYGEHKRIETYLNDWVVLGKQDRKYCYAYSNERFERPIKKAYKISIHKSYREGGKVKKKQWAIFTIDYYTLAQYGYWDYVDTKAVKAKLEEMNMTIEELYDMIQKKLEPLQERIIKEFEATEEYKVSQKHRAIISKYQDDKAAFEKVYGKDTYDCCYDVFGVLRNKDKLEEVKQKHKEQEEYKKRSYEEYYKSNYSNYSNSSYQGSNSSNYTEQEKEYLKIIYKAAAMKLHPDIKKDDGAGMKFLNDLKDKWGL